MSVRRGLPDVPAVTPDDRPNALLGDFSVDLTRVLGTPGMTARLESGLDHIEKVVNGLLLDRDDARHPWLEALCRDLHASWVGTYADSLLADADSLPDEPCALWVPPVWAWLHSRISLGRKEMRPGASPEADDARFLMPVRVDYGAEPIALLSPDPETGWRHDQTISWSAAGLGHSGIGSTSVHVSPYGWAAETEPCPVWGLPLRVSVPLLGDRRDLAAVLRALAEVGHQARWRLIGYFDHHVRKAVATAHTSVCIEMSDYLGHTTALLDETSLDAVADLMLLGTEDHPGYIAPMLDRCMQVGVFVKVEPLKYIRDTLRRDANALVRRAVGDPFVGRKVRAVALELGTADIDEIVETYRGRYPADKLSRDRAGAALSVAPDPMVQTLPFDQAAD